MTDSPDQATETAPQPPTDGLPASTPIDLTAIERDLEGVETALRRLDDGSYWLDEVTEDPIPDELLAVDPVARRAN